MREIVFILIVAAILFAMTAIRYRRQIVSIIAFWKELKTAHRQLRNDGRRIRDSKREQGISLVNCAKCGKWIAENQAVRVSTASFVCAETCSRAVKTA